MYSTRMIRFAKTGYLILSALFCAMGIVLLSWPSISIQVISRVAGAMLVSMGIVKLIGYFSKDLYRLAFQHDPALGLLAIALGLVLLLRYNIVVNALCLILGVEMITEGLFKVQTALDARRFGLNTWWLIFALAVIVGAVGVCLIVCPFEGARTLARLAGASLLIQGALGLSVALCAIRIAPNQQPDIAG